MAIYLSFLSPYPLAYIYINCAIALTRMLLSVLDSRSTGVELGTSRDLHQASITVHLDWIQLHFLNEPLAAWKGLADWREKQHQCRLAPCDCGRPGLRLVRNFGIPGKFSLAICQSQGARDSWQHSGNQRTRCRNCWRETFSVTYSLFCPFHFFFVAVRQYNLTPVTSQCAVYVQRHSTGIFRGEKISWNKYVQINPFKSRLYYVPL